MNDNKNGAGRLSIAPNPDKSDYRNDTQLGLWSHGPKWKRVYEFVHSRGKEGATRDEIAAAEVVAMQTCCGIVLELLRAGELVETGKTRRTRLDCPAKVCVARQFAKRKQVRRG